jgi:hypothetical protein
LHLSSKISHALYGSTSNIESVIGTVEKDRRSALSRFKKGQSIDRQSESPTFTESVPLSKSSVTWHRESKEIKVSKSYKFKERLDEDQQLRKKNG